MVGKKKRAAKKTTGSEKGAGLTGKEVISDVVGRHPETARVFFKHGLMCVGCGFAASETIEQGCMGHGIALGPLLKDLNEALRKGAK